MKNKETAKHATIKEAMLTYRPIWSSSQLTTIGIVATLWLEKSDSTQRPCYTTWLYYTSWTGHIMPYQASLFFCPANYLRVPSCLGGGVKHRIYNNKTNWFNSPSFTSSTRTEKKLNYVRNIRTQTVVFIDRYLVVFILPPSLL